MAQVRYQVIFSADGKPSVSVSSDDPKALELALPEASRIRQKLQARFTSTEHTSPQQPAVAPGPKPICPYHDRELAWMDRNGGFWSCHTKNPDGNWCSYRPGREGNGQALGAAAPPPH
jgi:hypothetical protein